MKTRSSSTSTSRCSTTRSDGSGWADWDVSGLEAGFACDGLDPQEQQLKDGLRPGNPGFDHGALGVGDFFGITLDERTIERTAEIARTEVVPELLAIDGVIRDVIEAADGGVFVQPGDAGALARGVRAFWSWLWSDERMRNWTACALTLAVVPLATRFAPADGGADHLLHCG